MYDDECVFCRDIARQKKAAIVYEDDSTMAFMDYAPVEPGHVLVIPKEHYVNIFDIEYEQYLKVHRLAKRLSSAVAKALGADAINIGQNNGPCANQVVMHYHLHIIPRWCNRNLDWNRNIASEKELNDTALRIRNSLDQLPEES